jgi:hypothetical protein
MTGQVDPMALSDKLRQHDRSGPVITPAEDLYIELSIDYNGDADLIITRLAVQTSAGSCEARLLIDGTPVDIVEDSGSDAPPDTSGYNAVADASGLNTYTPESTNEADYTISKGNAVQILLSNVSTGCENFAYQLDYELKQEN